MGPRFLSDRHFVSEDLQALVVPINRKFSCGSYRYILMPYMRQRDLRRLIRLQKPMQESKAVHYLGQLANIIATLHHNSIIHSDIRPEQVLIDEQVRNKSSVL